MKNKICFKIADLVFALDSADLTMLPSLSSCYEQFFTMIADSNKIDFTLYIKVQNFVVNNDLQKVPTFAENTWLLYKNNFEYFIMPKFQDSYFPCWVLRFDRDFNNVCIYCSKDSVLIKNGIKVIKNIFWQGPLKLLFLMYYMLKIQGGLIHAAGVAINNKGYVFPGVSNAGKSTLVKTCIKYGVGLWLSDERVVIKKHQNGFNVYGTPWPSAAKVAQNKGASLAGIFFIEHGNEPVIKPLISKEVIARLIPVTSIPWYDQEFTKLAFNFLDDLVNKIPAFEFSYKPEKKAVDTLQKFVANYA